MFAFFHYINNESYNARKLCRARICYFIQWAILFEAKIRYLIFVVISVWCYRWFYLISWKLLAIFIHRTLVVSYPKTNYPKINDKKFRTNQKLFVTDWSWDISLSVTQTNILYAHKIVRREYFELCRWKYTYLVKKLHTKSWQELSSPLCGKAPKRLDQLSVWE